MRIAVDAMGGDIGVPVNVQGALRAAKKYGVTPVLVGDEALIKAELAKYSNNKYAKKCEIVHTDISVGMDELPSRAIREKKGCSIQLGLQLVKSGDCAGFYSAGSTGAIMAFALLTLKRVPGVDRPAIGTIIPGYNHETLLLDVGANVDCKPLQLLQFAIMGTAYMRCLRDIPNPTVGLLNIGEEDVKGNELAKRSFNLLRELSNSGLIDFKGNLEAKAVMKDNGIDVAVCDGFVGNVTLKVVESVGYYVVKTFKDLVKADILSILGSIFMLRTLLKFRKKADYHEYGGAPLLGVNGVCIIGHGSSNQIAVEKGIKVCAYLAERKLNEVMSEQISKSLDYTRDIDVDEIVSI